MDKLLDKLEKQGIQKVGKEESEKQLFRGDTKIETMGFSAEDPSSPKQRRMIFALGGQLGLNKDDLKYEYDIDSMSDLKFAKAQSVINELLVDVGELKEKNVEQQTEDEKHMTWTREAGVYMVGSTFAKCGQCKYFTGENTLMKGECTKNNRKGQFDGVKNHPITKDCFVFKHGELISNIEVRPNIPTETIEDDDCPF